MSTIRLNVHLFVIVSEIPLKRKLPNHKASLLHRNDNILTYKIRHSSYVLTFWSSLRTAVSRLNQILDCLACGVQGRNAFVIVPINPYLHCLGY